MRNLIIAALATPFVLVTAASAQAETGLDLGFLEGEWTIHGADGEAVGSSDIVIQAPNAVLFEQRTVGDRPAQALWLVNSEDAGGWKQLFVGAAGLVREFLPQSPQGEWPLVASGDVTMRDGTQATFRLTMEQASDDESRRLLERSTDNGASWTTVLDYTYRRKAKH